MKRFLYYFAWTIGIGVVVYAGLQFQQSLVVRSQETFNPIPLWVYIAIFPIVIGLLMRLPKFLQERTERRIIGFDWSKFLAVSIPALTVIIVFGYVLLDSFKREESRGSGNHYYRAS